MEYLREAHWAVDYLLVVSVMIIYVFLTMPSACSFWSRQVRNAINVESDYITLPYVLLSNATLDMNLIVQNR